nr:hypothetical protein [Tanacetum cinerariifolium]
YSNHPYRELVNLINIFNLSSEDCLKDLVSKKQSGNPTFSLHKEIALPEVIPEIHDSKGCNFLSEELPDIDSFNDILPHFDDDPLSGNTTYSANSLLEEFADELALISYPLDYDDYRACDIESDIRKIEFLLFQGEDFDFKDSIDQFVLIPYDDLFVDPTPEMFTEEQPPDYSFPPRFDVYHDDLLEIKSDATFDDDSFDSEGEKIKEAELLIDPLDLPCDILSEYDSFNSQDFSRDDVLFSPNNEDKVFNLGILSHKKSVKIITQVTQEKKLAVSFASWLSEEFDPPFYELLVFKEVPNSMRLLPFSSENERRFSCFQSQSDFLKPDEDFSCSKWKEYSSLGCSYFLEIESDATFDDDSFDSEGEIIKEAEFLIDPLDLPCDILSEYDSFNSHDFSRDDVLFSPDNEDKVFNPGILSHEKSVKIITHVTQEKKLAVSFASWLSEDFDPPFSELLVFKEVYISTRLLPFSSENEKKVFKPGIYTSKKFHCCFLSDLSHLVVQYSWIYEDSRQWISFSQIFIISSV